MQGHPDTVEEQAHLDGYSRLDALRALSRARLASTMAQGSSGTHQNRSERDSFVSMYTDRLAALESVEARLLFGRLDTGRPHVDRSHRPHRRVAEGAADRLARPRCRAVLPGDRGEPAGRRTSPAHHAEDRRVAGLRRGARPRPGRPGRRATPAATPHCSPRWGAPHRADGRHRRDDPGRAGPHHPVRRQGGARRAGRPGTGKTAVALHRAAYLLYTHRERLEQSACSCWARPCVPALRRGVLRRSARRAWCSRRSPS